MWVVDGMSFPTSTKLLQIQRKIHKKEEKTCENILKNPWNKNWYIVCNKNNCKIQLINRLINIFSVCTFPITFVWENYIWVFYYKWGNI